MSEGEGFARRVTLANLKLFAPLLKTKPGGGTGTDGSNEQSADAANQDIVEDPELAAAEARFGGEGIKTGIRFSRPPRGPSGSPGKVAGGGSAGGYASSSAADEVLLMRVRPRRDGTQLQVSMRVLHSAFMNDATEVRSAADGTRRPIGFDHVKGTGGKKGAKKGARKGARNTARFEAPELENINNPVARFSWVDASDTEGGVAKVLKYEIFDADTSSEGKRILEKLTKGIATPPSLKLDRLSREETVMSKSDREQAQWYRLESVAT